MGDRMDKELFSIVILLGLVLATTAVVWFIRNLSVVPLTIKAVIGAGLLSCLFWVIVVMPRMTEVK